MSCPAGSSDGVGRKRKRVDGETAGKVGKKPKASHSEGDVIVIEESPPSGGQAAQKVSDTVPFGRSRRGRSQRQKQKEEPKPAELISPVGNQNDIHIIADSSVLENSSTEGKKIKCFCRQSFHTLSRSLPLKVFVKVQ